MTTTLLAILVVTIQLSDSYLHYLSFRDAMTSTERKNLSIRFLIWSVVCTAIYDLLFREFAMTASLYKIILMIGWSPWLAIMILTVRREISQHIFVFSMMKIWSLIQHNWSAIIVVLIGLEAPEFFFVHSAVYLLLFVICLPIERHCFLKLLPPKKFFDDYGRHVAFLPFMMILSVIILWAQEPLIHSWAERFSRFYLPFVFFFFYRHILITTEQLYERRLTNQNLRLMKEQLGALSEYNRLMQEGREKIAVMRHDLRHSYRLIHAMLQAGEFDAAKDYIATQEKLLGKTTVKNFCKPPLINAALSVYIRRAENLGIKVRHKINLPSKFSTDENDCAVLISNLLENAINASTRQPLNRREISVTIQNVGEQCVLEISNLCDETIDFGEKNMPQTSREGHGLGMVSVKIFADKYDAYTDFTQSNGVFKVTMYWMSRR